MGDYYPADPAELRRQGTRGVISTGAGVGLWLVNGLLRVPFLGPALGGVLVLLGILGLVGRNRTDRTTGVVLMAAGGAGLASLVLPGLSSLLFWLSGLGLVGFGLYNLFKFLRGLKSRA